MDFKPGDTIVVTAHIFLAMVADEMRKAANSPTAINKLADRVARFAEAIRRSEGMGKR